MNTRTIREELKRCTIYDLPLRVTFYARVSTDKDEQLNSLDNQAAFFTEKIRSAARWTLVPGYVDEGITGTSVAKRERFLQMIRDAKDGRFDLILTKEVSRFARNTVDSLTYTRDLLRHNVGVFFMNDGINTLDPDSELRLTIMSGIAQDESRKISSRVKFGSREAIKKGRVFGNSRIYGYDYVNKGLVINEREAAFVRELFERFATGNFSLNQLERLFYDEGFRNTQGGRINHAAMAKVIRNPKYKGWFCGGKTTIADPFDQRQIRIPREEWITFPDARIPALVSEEVWQKANAILERRSADVKARRGRCNHANLLSGKMVCTHCGLPYHRQATAAAHGAQPNSAWICSGKKKRGARTCPSRYIWESEMKDVLFALFQRFHRSREEMTRRIMDTLAQMQPQDALSRDIRRTGEAIEKLKARREKLLDLLMDGRITDGQFSEMMNALEAQMDERQAALAALERRRARAQHAGERLAAIEAALDSFDALATPQDITPALVDAVVRRIDVTTEGEAIRLDFLLADGTQLSGEIAAARAKGRGTNGALGNTGKRLVEQAERSMSGMN